MFGRFLLWSHLALAFCLLREYWLLIQFLYWLLVCSSFLFRPVSGLIVYIFLEVGHFFQIARCVFIVLSYNRLYFCRCYRQQDIRVDTCCHVPSGSPGPLLYQAWFPSSQTIVSGWFGEILGRRPKWSVWWFGVLRWMSSELTIPIHTCCPSTWFVSFRGELR